MRGSEKIIGFTKRSRTSRRPHFIVFCFSQNLHFPEVGLMGRGNGLPKFGHGYLLFLGLNSFLFLNWKVPPEMACFMGS